MIHNNRERIVQVVFHIPPGRVATYGQVAQLAGLGRAARLVGRTLKTLPDGSRLPWYRVVNAAGKISLPTDGGGQTQRQLLEEEGVTFVNGRIDLQVYGWRP